MNNYRQHHVLSLKLHKWRVPLSCPWCFSGCCSFFGSNVLRRRQQRGKRRNSQICWSAPSKCRCIDFDHRSFPLGCLCMPYLKQHSHDQGLVGAFLPPPPLPNTSLLLRDALRMTGAEARDQHGVTKIKSVMAGMTRRGSLQRG